MKKVLFSFAILAATAMMVACGNKSQQNTEEQDTAAVAEEQPSETASVAIVKTIDKDAYSIGLPEGWSAMSQGDTQCMVYKGSDAKPSEALNGTWVSMEISPSEDKTIEEGIKEMIEEMGAKQLDDVTIGGTTYKQCSYVEDGVESRILVSGTDNLVSFMMAHTTPDDPEVQAIISSLKLK